MSVACRERQTQMPHARRRGGQWGPARKQERLEVRILHPRSKGAAQTVKTMVQGMSRIVGAGA